MFIEGPQEAALGVARYQDEQDIASHQEFNVSKTYKQS